MTHLSSSSLREIFNSLMNMTGMKGRGHINSPGPLSVVDKGDVEAAGLLDAAEPKKEHQSTEIFGLPVVLFAGICYCMARQVFDFAY
jgi:hypothetical protein